MQKQSLKQRLFALSDAILKTKVIKIVIGKDKRPIDKPGEIIFHIDI